MLAHGLKGMLMFTVRYLTHQVQFSSELELQLLQLLQHEISY
jgi:hypothetical protein